MNKFYFSVFVLAYSMASFSFSGDNDPKHIVNNAEYRFESLALEAELPSNKTPWASSFFPHAYGGIAFRWNNFYIGEPTFAQLHYEVDDIEDEIKDLKSHLFDVGNTKRETQNLVSKILNLKNDLNRLNNEKAQSYQNYFFDIKRPSSLQEVRSMDQAQVDSLSAAEKYDIYVALLNNQPLDAKLTQDVLSLTGPYKAYWEGICNGWSSAAIEFKEPQNVVYEKDGIKINFYSSDLKGLLSHYHSAITRNWRTQRLSRTSRVGRRCKEEFSKESWFIKDGVEYYKQIVKGKTVIKKVSADCVDTDAGAFHVVMTNMLGIYEKSFVAEMVRDKEVWNQPVYKYKSKVTKLDRPYILQTKGTQSQLEVETELFYANDGGRMFWKNDGSEAEFYAWKKPTNGTSNYRYDSKVLKYILDLDVSGNIIGGHWLSYERPDFIWVKRDKGFLGTGFMYGIVGYMNDLRNLVELQD